MPNGFHGSRRDWDRMEAPLRRLDGWLAEYAIRHGMELGRNYHGWPERSLTWKFGEDEKDSAAIRTRVTRKLQIHLEEEHSMTFRVAIMAWSDGPDGRRWKHRILARSLLASRLHDTLEELLADALVRLRSWTEDDLEPAIGPHDREEPEKK